MRFTPHRGGPSIGPRADNLVGDPNVAKPRPRAPRCLLVERSTYATRRHAVRARPQPLRACDRGCLLPADSNGQLSASRSPLATLGARARGCVVIRTTIRRSVSEVFGCLGSRHSGCSSLRPGRSWRPPSRPIKARDASCSPLARMRTREGMASARANGRLKGKPPKLSSRQHVHVLKLHQAGEHTVTELAELFSVSRATNCREIKRARGARS